MGKVRIGVFPWVFAGMRAYNARSGEAYGIRYRLIGIRKDKSKQLKDVTSQYGWQGKLEMRDEI